MGKPEDPAKKRVKETPKSPISPVWIGQFPHPERPQRTPGPLLPGPPLTRPGVLGFLVVGGLLFEALSRMLG
ncbi:hypothetical protein UVI_02021980 [Ustilaginoidea virens]|uniref:Stress-associated endoplasmic reticulum protein n=1 Tax=Ustilaginoidea virens TaxID=1159556 RepID=A0A1B5L0Z3_USTVR|nr:hypothetical protein UVI_02021980 [Ustilaginoidea virens]